MKHAFSLLILSFIVFSTFGRSIASTPKDTVVLVNHTAVDFKFDLSYDDKFGDPIRLQRIKEKKIETETPYLEIRTQSSTYWLCKGKYSVSVIGENRVPVFQMVQQKETIQDKEAMFFVQLYWDNPTLKMNGMQLQNELKQGIFHTKSKDRYQHKIDYLENNKQNISPLFYNLCKKLFCVEYLNNLLYLYTSEKREDLKQILLEYKEYTQCEDLLFSQEYRQFCTSYSYLLNSESNTTKNYVRIKNDFTGKIQDYFLFNLVKTYTNKDFLDTFLNDCRDEEFRKYILRGLKVKEKLLSSKDLLIQANLSQISLESMLSNYMGKIIYVDVCASWCGPCRELFPLSHQLQEQFREDVVFIYLSVDDNVNQWENLVLQEDLNEQNSYLISEKSSFIQKHEIIGNKGIPYYMIFDRNGKLAIDNAMRPNDINFQHKMNEIVNKR